MRISIFLSRTWCLLIACLIGSLSPQAPAQSLLYSVPVAPGFPRSQRRERIGSLGDINGDGLEDFFTISSYDASTQTGMVDIHSAFDGSVFYSLPIGDAAIAGIGDIDGDGFGDIGIATQTTFPPMAQHQDIALAAFSGINGNPINLPALPSPAMMGRGLFAGVEGLDDLNGDGYPEIAVWGVAGADFNSGPSCLLIPTPGFWKILSGADGSILRQASTPVGSNAPGHFVRLGDLDLDGVDDFAISSRGNVSSGTQYCSSFPLRSSRLEIRSGASHALIQDSISSPLQQLRVERGGDINNDGRADILSNAVEIVTGGADRFFITALSGASSGFIHAFFETLVGSWSIQGHIVSAGDANGDGYSDFLLDRANTVRLLSGLDASVLWVITYPQLTNAHVTQLGDINGDGHLDFGSLLPNGDAYDVMSARPLTPASFNSLGPGTGPGTLRPQLTVASPPILGTNVILTLSQCTPQASGALLFSPPSTPSVLQPGAVPIYINLNTSAALVNLSVNSQGTDSHSISLPLLPSVAGLEVYLQGFTTPAATPLGIEVTSGVSLTLGF